MDRLQKLFFNAIANFLEEYISALHLKSNLFNSSGEGALFTSRRKPGGSLENLEFLNGNKSQPVLRIPAAIPLIVNKAPLNNSLLL